MGQRILTNKFNLPETLVKAVEYDTHKQSGDISVTTVIDGPQIRYLKKKHDYESDVVDNLYALMGTALHHIIERSNIGSVQKQAFITTAEYLITTYDGIKDPTQESQKEALKRVSSYLFQIIPILFPNSDERFIMERHMVMQYEDYLISGTFDLYEKESQLLDDYKFCSTYQYMNPDSRKKWEEQANIYAYMMRRQEIPIPVSRIRIIAFFRDWNAYGSLKDRDYPPRQIMEIEIPLWDDAKVEALLSKHLAGHRLADAGAPPECDGSIRWAKADEFAVKPAKGKRAVNGGVFDSMVMAENFLANHGHKYPGAFIEHRPGGSTRCEKFCPVSKFCPQYKKELENNAALAAMK